MHVKHREVYKNLKKGFFSFQKSNKEFSRMAVDQVHEQNNKVIKSAGGATDLVNKRDDSSLIRWETCGPDIARIIITEFEESEVLFQQNTMRIMTFSVRILNLTSKHSQEDYP